MSDPTIPGNEQGHQPGTPEPSQAPAQNAPQTPLQPGSSSQPPQVTPPAPSIQPPTIQQPGAPVPPQAAPQAPQAAQQAPQPGALAAPPAPPVPPMPPQPGQPGMPMGAPQAQAPMNTLALVAFIGSFFVGLVGIICGHISLGQIKKSGERGRGFALAGTIIGYVSTVGVIIAIIMLFVAASMAATLGAATLNEIDKSASASSESLAPDTTEPTDPATAEPTDPATTEPTTPSAGGTKSPAFCKAINNLYDASMDSNDTKKLGAALDEMAKQGGDHQKIYEGMAKMIKDPGSADASAMDAATDYPEAFSKDYLACQ